MWHDAPSLFPAGPSDTTFNEHEELREVNKNEIRFFGAFEHFSCDGVDALTAEFHNISFQNNLYSCNTSLALNDTKVHKKDLKHSKLQT